MNLQKAKTTNNPMQYVDTSFYEYYVAVDWSPTVISIATMRSNSIDPKILRDLPAKPGIIKKHLKQLKGKTILTIEETTGAQWLYVELRDFVDRIVICDPFRNSLLKEGPKNDPKDASDLCRLLRSGLLKEVYHCDDEDYKIRKLVSSYDDAVKALVVAKNQLSSIYRAYGLNYKKDQIDRSEDYINHIIKDKEETIKFFEEQIDVYKKKFREIAKQNPIINNLRGISGIDIILAVKIYSVVIDARRFPNKYKYWAYSGLTKYKIESGGRYYGQKNTKYSRKLKEAYKVATQAALRGNNDIREYFETMLKQGVPQKDARNTVCRYIAKTTYGMMKNGSKYQPYSWRKIIVN